MALPNGDLVTTVFDPQMGFPLDRRMQIETLNARDSISMFIRWEGMTVYVLEDGKIYILQGGRSNEYWKELGLGSGTGGTTFVGQFATADLLPTTGRSAGDYAFVGTGDDFAQYNWDNISGQWVMAEGQTDMASEFFHIGYKTPLRRPVIFPLKDKDVVIEDSGSIIIAPSDPVGNYILTGEVDALNGLETATEGRENHITNRSGSPIDIIANYVGGPANSAFNFPYTLSNGDTIAVVAESGLWELGVVNQVAFSDHLDSLNATLSTDSNGLDNISGIQDVNTGASISFKEVPTWVDGTSMTDGKIDGFIFIKYKGKYFADTNFLDDGCVRINRFGAKSDGVTDDTLALNDAINVANNLQSPLIGGGRYLVKNTIDLRTIPHADLDLVVADDFEDEYVVTFANIPSRSRSYTIRIDGMNVIGVTGIELQDPTIGQLYIKAILYRLERGIHVFRNGEKLKLDIFAYQCGTVLEENSTLVGELYSTPDENHFNITGSGCNTWYHCSSGVSSSTVFFNVEGNYVDSEKAVIIDGSGDGKLITLAGTIRGFQCGIYINNPDACVDFNDLYLNDGGRIDRYTELEANALLPAVKVITARTLTGRINLKPTYLNTLQIDQLTSGGDLNVLITNFRANCVQIGNDSLTGSVIGLNLILHASDPLAIFDNYLLKVCANVQDSFINLLSTGNRKIILDSNKISLSMPSSFFIGIPGVIEGSVTKLPINIQGEMTHGQMSLYPYKIKGMRAFNSTLQRWMYWDGLEWMSDSFSMISNSSLMVENPPGGILDLSNITTSTGALVIKFPYIPISGPQGLYEIDLEILDYGTPSENKTMSIKLTGLHGLSSAPSWTRAYASANDFSGRNLPIKFGFNDDGYPVILVGENTSVWSNAHFQIKKVKRTRKTVSGYDSTYMDQPWSLSVEPDLSDITVITTINDAYSWGDYNKLINKPSLTVPDSSTTVKGIIELATQTEVNTGTDAVRSVTPLTLQGKFDAFATYGTYTPIINSSGTNPTLTYTTQYGAWRKIGRLMQFEVRLEWTAITGAGTGSIGISMPEGRDISESNNATIGGLSIGLCSGITVTNGITATYLGTSTGVRFYDYDGVIFHVTALKATGILLISGSYRTSS